LRKTAESKDCENEVQRIVRLAVMGEMKNG
jgi:hypothetical protein